LIFDIVSAFGFMCSLRVSPDLAFEHRLEEVVELNQHGIAETSSRPTSDSAKLLINQHFDFGYDSLGVGGFKVHCQVLITRVNGNESNIFSSL